MAFFCNLCPFWVLSKEGTQGHHRWSGGMAKTKRAWVRLSVAPFLGPRVPELAHRVQGIPNGLKALQTIVTRDHTMSWRTLGNGLILGTLISCLSGCEKLWNQAQAKEERTLTETWVPGGGLDIQTQLGSITIKADPAAKEIGLVAKITAFDSTEELAREFLKEIKVSATRRADKTLEIRSEIPKRTSWLSASVSWEVTLPEAGKVQCVTGNGSIHLTGLNQGAQLKSSIGSITVLGHQGAIEAETGNGSIKIEDAGGKVVAQTSIGRITLQNAQGPVEIRSGNGSLEVQNVRGGVQAHTSIGSISVEKPAGPVTAKTGNGAISIKEAHQGVDAQTSIGSIKLSQVGGSIHGKTDNGSLEVRMDPEARDEVRLKTGIGSIDLHVSSSLGGVLEAKTGIGQIKLTGNPASLKQNGDKRSQQFILGEKGPQSSVQTGNGSIKLSWE